MAGRNSLRRPASLPSLTRTQRHAARAPLALPAINSLPSTLNSPLASPGGVGGVGGGLAGDPGDQPHDAGCLNIGCQTCSAGFPPSLYGLSGAGAAVVGIDWAARDAGGRTAKAPPAPAQERGAKGTGHGLGSVRAGGEIRSPKSEIRSQSSNPKTNAHSYEQSPKLSKGTQPGDGSVCAFLPVAV